MLKGFVVLSEGKNYRGEYTANPPGKLFLTSKREPMTFEEAEELAKDFTENNPEATFYVAELVSAFKVAKPVIRFDLKK